MGLHIGLPLFLQPTVVACVVILYQHLPETGPPLGGEVSSLVATGNSLLFSHTSQRRQVQSFTDCKWGCTWGPTHIFWKIMLSCNVPNVPYCYRSQQRLEVFRSTNLCNALTQLLLITWEVSVQDRYFWMFSAILKDIFVLSCWYYSSINISLLNKAFFLELSWKDYNKIISYTKWEKVRPKLASANSWESLFTTSKSVNH